MKYRPLIAVFFIVLFACSGKNKGEPTPATNELVGTRWRWILQHENDKEVYSDIYFKDGAELQIRSNLNDEGIEKLVLTYPYTYDKSSATIKYAIEERPFCRGTISGDTMIVTCGLQHVFTKVR